MDFTIWISQQCTFKCEKKKQNKTFISQNY